MKIASRHVPRLATQEQTERQELQRRTALTFAVEQAWRTLEHSDRAIDRADAKAAAVLAADGAIAVTLFTLAGKQVQPDAFAVVALALGAAFTVATAILTGLTLWPRRYRSSAPATLVYYGDIARMTESSVNSYVAQASVLFIDPDALSQQLASQIWATGRVAATKYMWVNLAIASLLCSLAVTSMGALFIAV